MKEIEIRMATPNDADGIASLCHHLGYPCQPNEARKRLDRSQRENSTRANIVAASQGRVVAWIEVLLRDTIAADVFGEIDGLIVDEELRGGGIGSRLVEEACKWVRQRGAQRLRVRSNVTREHAHSFYGRLGFRPVKNQVVMDRPLDQDV